MLFFTSIILLSQGLLGSSYVVVEENGYYTSWRSNPLHSQMTQWSWPGFMNPQMYSSFNLNPLAWWQSQQSMAQDEMEMELIRDRQTILFNIIRCILKDEKKEDCRTMSKRAVKLFPESEELMMMLVKPVEPLRTEHEMAPSEKCRERDDLKPLEIINLGIDSSALQGKLSEAAQNSVKNKSEDAKMDMMHMMEKEDEMPSKIVEGTLSEKPMNVITHKEELVEMDKEHMESNEKNEQKIDNSSSLQGKLSEAAQNSANNKPEDAKMDMMHMMEKEIIVEGTLSEKPMNVITLKEELVEMDKEHMESNEKIMKVASEKPIENQSIDENRQTVTMLPESTNGETAVSDENPVEDKSSIKEMN